MIKINYFFLLVISICFILSSFVFAQMHKLEKPNLYTEADIYLTPDGVKYSDLITLKFNKLVIDNNVNPHDVDTKSFLKNDARDYFSNLKKNYGNFRIVKSIPTKFWGDTIAINKRTKKKVIIPDVSQLIVLRFNKLVPIDSIVSDLTKQDFISFAEGPKESYLCYAPNDPLYSSATHWAFDRIEAENAWDITTGSSSILIAINDRFYIGSQTQTHEDLIGKVVYASSYYGDHGASVAGIVGANTNNNLGIASLGWNVSLMFTDYLDPAQIDLCVDYGADVINLSWITQQTDYQDIREAIIRALLQGVVVVAASGNQVGNVNYIPSVQYPAAYNFGPDTGQVIAVSATQWDGTNETFVDGWNYSPGTDPINDPTNSFIDISAPGMNIEIITGTNTYSPNGQGTSDAAPFVSALVGLMLSVNDTLTPVQVYDILKNSSDKIGQYSYDNNGWNRYMGYGRINAANAINLANNTSPSQPQNLNLSIINYHPYLTWSPNPEPDIAGYNIYRTENSNPTELIAYIPKIPRHTYYTDNLVHTNLPYDTISYKIKAKNNSDLLSVYSDEVSVMATLQKPNPERELNISQTNYSLAQNYPNPFNPSTEISYSLKEDGIVIIKVFDVLGKEVAVLKNKLETAGNHNVNFNATNLPSGIYFYRITAGSFHQTRKMLLLK